MNKDRYAELPADLQAVIDQNSGVSFSAFAGEVQQAFDDPAREIALDRGNNIVTLDADQSRAWADAAQPVYDAWIAEMDEKGIDGAALIERAKALMAENAGS